MTKLSIALATTMAAAALAGCTELGATATGERLARMRRSPQWQDGGFENPQPIVNDAWETIAGFLETSDDVAPSAPVPIVTGDPARFAAKPESGLRVTWLGHSSTIVEIDGYRVLTDPVWSERVSPVGWIGPKRWYDAPVALDALPPIDAVVISHDHYDHLDAGTVRAMQGWSTKFYVPLGIGAHLEAWGVPAARIVEMDWWDEVEIGELKLVMVPARHASGRQVFDYYATLWSGFALVGPKHRVYYSGDTGLFPALKEIGEKLGPFDVTLIESGQYHQGWPDWHLGPEQAVVAHQMVRGKVLLPVHWAKFSLAYHGWTEPVERVLAEAKERGVVVAVPRIGESVELGGERVAAPAERWWPELIWMAGKDSPIVSSQMPVP